MSSNNLTSLPTPEEMDRMAARFRALGEPMRLRILQVICKESRSVNDIVAATGSTQANISKHLALLTTAGILEREKDGQRVFYGVKDKLALKLCELVRAQVTE
ncbi:MAG: metalloregulator ArsR/SmtB family transcription factor [Verrucomicrobia bacterium]|nr:metalloregulator ArsR/SmtB family transcription factor [Verrucomicrobiota bacterium]